MPLSAPSWQVNCGSSHLRRGAVPLPPPFRRTVLSPSPGSSTLLSLSLRGSRAVVVKRQVAWVQIPALSCVALGYLVHLSCLSFSISKMGRLKYQLHRVVGRIKRVNIKGALNNAGLEKCLLLLLFSALSLHPTPRPRVFPNGTVTAPCCFLRRHRPVKQTLCCAF